MRKKLVKFIKNIMPVDRMLITVFAFVFNCTLYGLARVIAGDWPHYILMSRLDEQIPFLPASIIIYFGCYLFWAVNYVMIAKLDKKWAYQFYFADMISRIICFAIFLIFPTTNIRPAVSGTGIWEMGMRFLYSVDAADNLFPSIHCLVSWFCYIGIRDNDKIPKWYQRMSCVMAVLVFVSTLTTKQHVVIDVVGGVAIAELTLAFARHTNGYKWYMKMWMWIAEHLFEAKEETNGKGEKEYL